MAVERLSEGGRAPLWIQHEHEARYLWAAPQANGLSVVDAACGTGYGARLLVDHGAVSVHGFDVSAESIDEARRLHTNAAVTFDVADATDLPSADDSYDLFLSFETIEHIDDDRSFLREVVRVLRAEGTFICSTPNRNVTNPGTSISDKPFNQFHVREYDRSELESLLREFFADVEMLGQTPRSTSYVKWLDRLGKRSSVVAVRFHQVRKLLGIPRESLPRHRPELWPTNGEHEVLVAVCRRPA